MTLNSIMAIIHAEITENEWQTEVVSVDYENRPMTNNAQKRLNGARQDAMQDSIIHK